VLVLELLRAEIAESRNRVCCTSDPANRVSSELASGALVEAPAGFPPSPLPIHILYSHTRQLSPRLRVFIDWMAEQFRPALAD
jgi:DNA-binding transcriptional LysR family regulator